MSLAFVAKLKGYKVKVVLPDNVSEERTALLRAYGAEIVYSEGVKGGAKWVGDRSQSTVWDVAGRDDGEAQVHVRDEADWTLVLTCFAPGNAVFGIGFHTVADITALYSAADGVRDTRPSCSSRSTTVVVLPLDTRITRPTTAASTALPSPFGSGSTTRSCCTCSARPARTGSASCGTTWPTAPCQHPSPPVGRGSTRRGS